MAALTDGDRQLGLIALLLAEPEADRFVAALAGAPSRLVSAASYLETAIVMLARSGPMRKRRLIGSWPNFP
jgi:ribonuclease VapC